MVVFDQDAVIEAESMVMTAAATNGVSIGASKYNTHPVSTMAMSQLMRKSVFIASLRHAHDDQQEVEAAELADGLVRRFLELVRVHARRPILVDAECSRLQRRWLPSRTRQVSRSVL